LLQGRTVVHSLSKWLTVWLPKLGAYLCGAALVSVLGVAATMYLAVYLIHTEFLIEPARGREPSRVEAVMAGQSSPFSGLPSVEKIVPLIELATAAEVWQHAAALDRAEALDVPVRNIRQPPGAMTMAAAGEAVFSNSVDREAMRESMTVEQATLVSGQQRSAGLKSQNRPTKSREGRGGNRMVKVAKNELRAAVSSFAIPEALTARPVARTETSRVQLIRLAALETPGELVRLHLANAKN
jgi:hypothetical protein